MDKIIEKLNKALTPEEIDTLLGEACKRYEWLRFTQNGANIERIADIYDKDIHYQPTRNTQRYLNGKFKRFVLNQTDEKQVDCPNCEEVITIKVMDDSSFACELDSRNLPRLGRVLYNTYFAKYEGGAS